MAIMQEVGMIYTMAQDAIWVTAKYLVSINFDGRLSLYRFQAEKKQLTLKDVYLAPLATYDLMLTNLNRNSQFLVSGYSKTSISQFSIDEVCDKLVPQFDELRWNFDEKLGGANCGEISISGEHTYILTGHANGYLAIWNRDLAQSEHIFDFSSEVSTLPFKNIRSLSMHQHYMFVGSENGFIYLVDVPSRHVLFKLQYNVDAKFGINSLSFLYPQLVVGVCKDPSEEYNTYVFRLDDDERGKPQRLHLEKSFYLGDENNNSFTFDVKMTALNSFLATSKEGKIFLVEHLSSITSNMVEATAAGVIAVHQSSKTIAVVCRDIKLFELK